MHLKTEEILAEGNVRHDLDPASIAELAQSIMAVHTLSNGEKTLLQPITVEKLKKKTPEGHTHVLRYGFRRLAAMQYLLATYPEKCFWADQIPVIVDDAVYNEIDGALANFRLIENIQREDMSLLEEATTLANMMADGAKQSDLAKTLGKSKGWVSQRLSLLKLDESIQLGVQDGVFGQAHVRELARVKKKSDQATVAAALLKSDDVSVEKVRKAVNKIMGPPAERKAKPVKEAPAAKVVDTKAAEELEAPEMDEWDEADAELAAQASLPTSEPTRASVIQTLTHEEKIAFLKEDSAARAAAADGRAATCLTTLASLQKQAADALQKGLTDEAAFYAGAAQGIEFARGSLNTIAFMAQKVAS